MQENKAQKPLVLHVSGDFPDPIAPQKTPVIQSLLALTQESFDHRVISINRIAPSSGATLRELLAPTALKVNPVNFNDGTALSYLAPSKGIRHRTKLLQLGRWIAAFIGKMERKPDLIVGHKLTIEGIAVEEAAKLTNLPFALCLQGNTDMKIISLRPDLRARMAQIFHRAAQVFPFTPWALEGAQAKLGHLSKPATLLPCPTELDQPTPPTPKGDGFVSVFHLRNYKNKNLSGMVKSLEQLDRDHVSPRLEIIGGGTEDHLASCKEMTKGTTNITFAGPMGREELPARLNKATAFLLPSHRESFGLVFIEALFAGLPIIYPKGTAVDGYFDEKPFALGVQANDPSSIATAMRQCLEHEAMMKSALTKWQSSPEARQFTRPAIAKAFAHGLNQAMGRTP